jgi:6-phosphogluconolactonase
MMNKAAFYIAARSQEAQGGIYAFDRDLNIVSFAPLQGASCLALHPEKPFLYSVSRAGTENFLTAWKIGPDGALEFLDRRNTHGQASCHLTADPSGQWLYCANYTSGDFDEFKLEDGLFAEADMHRQIHHDGTPGPVAARQEGPHPHCTVFTPDGKYLCVTDLGLDEVRIYAFSPENGITETPSFRYHASHPGAGPRHLLFAPDGVTAWLVNEIDSTLSILRYEAGQLFHRATISLLPEGCRTESYAAALRLSADGRFLCISNRGHDSIACGAVLSDGMIRIDRFTPVGGKYPRDINFIAPDLLVSCNETSSDMTFFHYVPEDGNLFPTGKQITLQSPVWALPS